MKPIKANQVHSFCIASIEDIDALSIQHRHVACEWIKMCVSYVKEDHKSEPDIGSHMLEGTNIPQALGLKFRYWLRALALDINTNYSKKRLWESDEGLFDLFKPGMVQLNKLESFFETVDSEVYNRYPSLVEYTKDCVESFDIIDAVKLIQKNRKV